MVGGGILLTSGRAVSGMVQHLRIFCFNKSLLRMVSPSLVTLSKFSCSLPEVFCCSVVQLLSCVRLFATPRTAALQASLSPGACSDSCPLSWWCHPTISSSVISFSSCLQSFPASGSFQMSQFFASGGQSIGASGWASVLLMNIQDWFPLGWTGWISLQSKGLSRVFSNITVQKHQFSITQLSL